MATTEARGSSEKHVMLSGRFDKPEIVDYMKTTEKSLQMLGVKTFMVNCKAGEDFGEQTALGLYNAWALIVFGTSEYGAKTGARYETYYELRHAHENDLVIVPIQLCNIWPPQPRDHDGGHGGAAQNRLVLRNAIVRLVDKNMEMPETIAGQIAERLLGAKEASGHGALGKSQEPSAGYPKAKADPAEEPSAGYPKAKADPAEALQWYDRGRAGGGTHEGQSFTEAECFAKAIEAYPKGHLAAAAWQILGLQGGGVVLGVTHSEKNCYLKAVELHPEFAYAWHSLGNVGGGTVAGKEYSRKECYLKALDLDPTNSGAWNNLGWHEGGGTVNGHAYSPKDCYVKALELDPESAAAWDSLGTVGGGLVAGQMYSDAECYQKSLELNPNHSQVWTNFGNAGGGIIAGHMYSAKECYQKALKLDPNNELAQENLIKCWQLRS